MLTKYYSANVVMRSALCDKCGSILRYVRSNFSRKNGRCWLHRCDGCGKGYWLGDKYPTPDYLMDTSKPLEIKVPLIDCEEASAKDIAEGQK